MPVISSEFMEWRRRTTEKQLPEWEEIPDFGLYMDQVIGLINDYLSPFGVDEAGDRAVTPSMINNYVKMGIVPPPDRKRYGRRQIAILITVCVLKQIISISEIKTILDSKFAVMEMKDCYSLFREVVNESTVHVTAIINELTGGFEKYIEGNDLIDIAVLVAVFANVGRTISRKIITLEAKSAAEITGKTPVADESGKKERRTKRETKRKENQ